MTRYQQLLQIARQQMTLAEAGDLDGAVAHMATRQQLLAGAPRPTTAEDEDAIREVLRLDRDLATKLRERMIAIRNEAVGLQQGRTALRGYRPPTGERRPRRLNVVG